MRILIVEDNVDAGETLRLILDALGHELLHVLDGESALAMTPRFRPQVVVMDLGLPGITGYETSRLMRAAYSGGKMTIVALTGWGRAEDIERSLKAGVDYHFIKPLNIDMLKEVLRMHPEADMGAE